MTTPPSADDLVVAVKLLDWRFFDLSHDYGRGLWDASTPWRTLTIQYCTRSEGIAFPFYCPEIADQFKTLEEAQAAVQKWHERNVRSALDRDAIAALLLSEREAGRVEGIDVESIAWMREAMQETLAMARAGHMDERRLGIEGLDFDHIEFMPERATQDFSAAKLGRWLGWMQAAVVASGAASLNDMKAINKQCSERIRTLALTPREEEAGKRGIDDVTRLAIICGNAEWDGEKVCPTCDGKGYVDGL